MSCCSSFTFFASGGFFLGGCCALVPCGPCRSIGRGLGGDFLAGVPFIVLPCHPLGGDFFAGSFASSSSPSPESGFLVVSMLDIVLLLLCLCKALPFSEATTLETFWPKNANKCLPIKCLSKSSCREKGLRYKLLSHHYHDSCRLSIQVCCCLLVRQTHFLTQQAVVACSQLLHKKNQAQMPLRRAALLQGCPFAGRPFCRAEPFCKANGPIFFEKILPGFEDITLCGARDLTCG